jgi:hypothetical protein
MPIKKILSALFFDVQKENTFLAVSLEMMKRHNRSISLFSFLDYGDKETFAKRLTEAGFKDILYLIPLLSSPVLFNPPLHKILQRIFFL